MGKIDKISHTHKKIIELCVYTLTKILKYKGKILKLMWTQINSTFQSIFHFKETRHFKWYIVDLVDVKKNDAEILPTDVLQNVHLV